MSGKTTSYWKQKLRAEEAEQKIKAAEKKSAEADKKIEAYKERFKSLADQWTSLAKTLPGDKGVRLISCSNEIRVLLED